MRDIWLFSGSSNIEGELSLSVGNGFKAVTGIEKLVNKVVHIFFTEVGTDLAYPDTGSSLASKINGNMYFGEKGLKGFILLAIDEVKSLIKSNQESIISPDERLVDLILITYSFTKDSITIELEVVSESGKSRVVKVPTNV